jgi:hypothetical protein
VVTPEQWGDEQREFASGWLAGRVGAERARVKILWWSVPNRHRRGGAGRATLLWSMARGNTLADRDVHVALYDPAAPAGAAPVVVFVALDGSGLDESGGRATGTAVGRLAPWGTLVVETSRGTVVPASVPRAPDGDDPVWSETDVPVPRAAPVDGGDPGPAPGAGRVSRWRRRPRPAGRADRTRAPGAGGGG